MAATFTRGTHIASPATRTAAPAAGAPLLLALACALCTVAAPGTASSGQWGFLVGGHAVLVPTPPGTIPAPDLIPGYGAMLRQRGNTSMDLVAVFALDPATATDGQRQSPFGMRMPMAYVAVPHDRESPEFGWGFIRDQQRRNQALSAREGPADDSLGRRARALIARDPDGTANLPIDLPPGSRVTLAGIAVDSSASGIVTAASVPLSSGEDAQSLVVLSGQATVVTQGEVLGVFQQRYVQATTRSAAAFRDAFTAWVRSVVVQAPARPAALEPVDPEPASELPKFGEYVYVEELPEATYKVPPSYPEASRAAGISGTVMVQALVGRDGRVRDAKVVRSVPELDPEAVAAVEQWRFIPAKTKGRPVAVWVAIPVKFSLH